MELELIEQKSPEWFELRRGKFTSSELWKLFKTDRSKQNFGEVAKTYVMDKVSEIITGTQKEVNGLPVKWGNYYEPIAKAEYEQLKEVSVMDVGFVEYSNYFGGSPDGLVGSSGIIEIKCPFNTNQHIENFMLQTAADFWLHSNEYYYQIQGNLLATDRKWCDFISYDVRCSDKFRIKVIRIERDEPTIEQIKLKVNEAGDLLDSILKKLVNLP